VTPGMGRSPSSDRGIGIRKGSLMIQSNSAGVASNSSSSSPEPAVAGWRVDHCADGERRRARAGRPLVRPAVGTPMMWPIPTPSPTQGPHQHHPGHRHAALPAQQPAGAPTPEGRSQRGAAVRLPLQEDRQPFCNLCLSARGPPAQGKGVWRQGVKGK
jgi:hypothetical protein